MVYGSNQQLSIPPINNRLSDYYYDLDPNRIAQRPVEPRDAARLLVSKKNGVTDLLYRDIIDILEPGDLLILNDTKVIPARLKGYRKSGGRNEVFLSRPLAGKNEWEALVASNKRIKNGLQVFFTEGFSATVLARTQHGFQVRLDAADGDVEKAINTHGQMPLPPYIVGSDKEEDKERYQTVFAKNRGALAAPTAGLHFTPELLQKLQQKGVKTATITLHVGIGTFQPIREEDLAKHVMHHEWCSLSYETAQLIKQTKKDNRRVVAVGTTVTRTLESAALKTGMVEPFVGETNLFILPGFKFQVVDLLLTNFHLPESTLLMLVAAFIGKTRLDRDYRYAIESGFRFYSYGDSSLLYPE
ncbi:MAG: tRNA preQ1(34) S-adenosylmethionine ribosyltransferase-isomerase QueA [Magnetococcales bacterium]|nr:tRNA preQ1(34) S-adenosylmethionine ribosyltransferase-isomerase QueA [Magnetococcales bacterium]